jgi:hypothetical protein
MVDCRTFAELFPRVWATFALSLGLWNIRGGGAVRGDCAARENDPSAAFGSIVTGVRQAAKHLAGKRPRCATPAATDDVSIPAGRVIVVQSTTAKAGTIAAEGELLVDNVNSALEARAIIVMGLGGRFEEVPFAQNFTLTLKGGDAAVEKHHRVYPNNPDVTYTRTGGATGELQPAAFTDRLKNFNSTQMPAVAMRFR